MHPWDDPRYRRIRTVEIVDEDVLVTFDDDGEARTPLHALGWGDVRRPRADIDDASGGVRLSATDRESQVLPWTELRAASDAAFARHLRTRDQEEARRVGARIRAMRDDRGLTQAELARRVGMTRPQLNKIEKGSDIRVSTLTSLIRALGATWSDVAGPDSAEVSSRQLATRATRAGAPKELVAALGKAVSRDRFADVLAKAFGWTKASLVAPTGAPELVPSGRATFKTAVNQRRDVTPLVSFCHNLATVTRGVAQLPPFEPLPHSAWEVREELRRNGIVTFAPLLEWTWNRGVAVVPISTAGQFHAAVWPGDNAPFIALKNPQDLDARWAFDLAHELAHVALGHLDEDGLVEESIGSDDDREEEADTWALTVLLGEWPKVVRSAITGAHGNVVALKQATRAAARAQGVSVGVLAGAVARTVTVNGKEGAWWGAATNLAQEEGPARSVACRALQARLPDEIDPVLAAIIETGTGCRLRAD